MKISEKRSIELYDAIREPIMVLRIKRYGAFANHPELQVDNDLFKLEQEIWRRVASVLRLEKP